MAAKKTVREREAAAMRRKLDRAQEALRAVAGTWGTWADSVREGADARQDVAPGAELQEDAQYWAALDAGEAINRSALALADTEARFCEAEAIAAHDGPDVEPEVEP